MRGFLNFSVAKNIGASICISVKNEYQKASNDLY